MAHLNTSLSLNQTNKMLEKIRNKVLRHTAIMDNIIYKYSQPPEEPSLIIDLNTDEVVEDEEDDLFTNTEENAIKDSKDKCCWSDVDERAASVMKCEVRLTRLQCPEPAESADEASEVNHNEQTDISQLTDESQTNVNEPPPSPEFHDTIVLISEDENDIYPINNINWYC